MKESELRNVIRKCIKEVLKEANGEATYYPTKMFPKFKKAIIDGFRDGSIKVSKDSMMGTIAYEAYAEEMAAAMLKGVSLKDALNKLFTK
jgi:hypothetical protein